MQTKLLIPGRNLPAFEKFIIAHVRFDGQDYTYKFGRNTSIAHIWSVLPKLVTDERFDKMIRERGVVLSLDAVRNRRAMTA